MTHTPDTEPINDKASEIVAFLHLMNRHDLSGALTRERLTMIRMVSDLVEHRRRLFVMLESLNGEVGSDAARALLDKLRPQIDPMGPVPEIDT